MPKKVLIITCFFPPVQTIASVRLNGLAKYISEYGWEPVILTPKLYGKVDSRFDIIQAPYRGNLRDIAINAFSEKFNNNKLVWEFLEFPDSYKNWRKTALKYAREYIQENKVEGIFSSSSPPTTHLVAKQLKKEFDIPWVADMRDLWSMNQNYEYSNLRLFFDKLLEKKVLAYADAITTVSQPLVDIQSEFLKSENVYSVPNGFDPDNVLKEQNLEEDFTITYAGRVYERYQKVDYLFRAISELVEDGKINSNKFKVNFWGAISNVVKESIIKYDLSQIVSFCGTISHEEILEKQRKSHLLLYLNWEDKTQKGIYLGKIFEYLCCRRPVLAIGGSDNVVTELIQSSKAGVCVKKDIELLKQTILKFYNTYNNSGYISYEGIEEEINKYTHREMARKFSEVLAKVIKN